MQYPTRQRELSTTALLVNRRLREWNCIQDWRRTICFVSLKLASRSCTLMESASDQQRFKGIATNFARRHRSYSFSSLAKSFCVGRRASQAHATFRVIARQLINKSLIEEACTQKALFENQCRGCSLMKPMLIIQDLICSPSSRMIPLTICADEVT